MSREELVVKIESLARSLVDRDAEIVRLRKHVSALQRKLNYKESNK